MRAASFLDPSYKEPGKDQRAQRNTLLFRMTLFVTKAAIFFVSDTRTLTEHVSSGGRRFFVAVLL